jgi:hypothetical protein
MNIPLHDEMSTSTLALRFSLIYFGLLVVSLLLCRIVGRDSFALLNSMSLFAAVNLACFTYGKTNTHYLNKSQKIQVWLAIVAVATIFQLTLAALHYFVAKADIPLDSQLFLYGVVPVMHCAIAYFGILTAEKKLLKAGFIKS